MAFYTNWNVMMNDHTSKCVIFLILTYLTSRNCCASDSILYLLSSFSATSRTCLSISDMELSLLVSSLTFVSRAMMVAVAVLFLSFRSLSCWLQTWSLNSSFFIIWCRRSSACCRAICSHSHLQNREREKCFI